MADGPALRCASPDNHLEQASVGRTPVVRGLVRPVTARLRLQLQRDRTPADYLQTYDRRQGPHTKLADVKKAFAR